MITLKRSEKNCVFRAFISKRKQWVNKKKKKLEGEKVMSKSF